MKLPCLNAMAFWLFLLHANLLICINSARPTFGFIPTLRNETDRLALMALKDRITVDPTGILKSWNSNNHFCKWPGVSCSQRRQRVMALNLNSLGLVGALSPSIANLSFLRKIDFGENSFHGEIPQEIGRLFRLRFLNLTQNFFGGEIPPNLSHCSQLRVVQIYDNNITGSIPTWFGSLPKLRSLVLGENSLTGSIPPSLGNLSSLIELSLVENHLQGSIPHELGQLSNLIFLQLALNNLSGEIPSPLYNLSSIYFFAVTRNRLHGSLPADVGRTLPNLQYFLVGGNQFMGSIPISILNASSLKWLFLPNNNFSGAVPSNIGNLRRLVRLVLGRNQLGSTQNDDLGFLTSLVNCSNLEVLDLDQNHFSGIFPNSVANLSANLQFLLVGANQISGSIPKGIGNLISLMQLGLEENLFTGIIPDTIGNLPRLQQLSLFGNKFSGEIPSSLANISQLYELDLGGNLLAGPIPLSLGNCQSLQMLDLSANKFNGTIPKEVISLPSLSNYLHLGQNSLSGNLPLEVGRLKNLLLLDVSDNELSGVIPQTIGDCVSLENLYLQGNLFQGVIPPSLGYLRVIRQMDLSRNNLSGQIPKSLQTLHFLKLLNLSFNNLEGEVPKEGVFQNASAVSILGSNKLCGGSPILHLPTCSITTSKRQRSVSLRVLIPVISSILCLILLSCLITTFCWKSKLRKKPTSSVSSKDGFLKLSYTDLVRATDGFSSANLIGVGSYGSVYKGVLDNDGAVLAIKVFDLQRQGASRSFLAECEALRNIRHRNLLKIITSCSSIDWKGNDFKALVFEFMRNGSLDDWLHTKEGGPNNSRNLNHIQRLDIAIDVASALDYLHHNYDFPIIHCDLKPSNVLIDDDLCAHVGDFGLAKILSETAADNASENQTSSVMVKGSIGYAAPEYGLGEGVSTHGDVYSYGILLLGMFTGKRPTDDMFKDGLSLHTYAKIAFPERALEIIDHRLLEHGGQEEEEEEEDNDGDGDEITICGNQRNNHALKNSVRQCLALVVRLALLCSAESPRERMSMKDVLAEMHKIRDLYLRIAAFRRR